MSQRFAILAVAITAAAAATAVAVVGTPVLAQTAATGQTLTFRDLEKGSTFSVIDNPPKAKRDHGFLTAVSAGDQYAVVQPLADGTGRLGELRLTCIATHNSRNPRKGEPVCTAAYVLRDGTLYAHIDDGDKVTEGAIVGGTGAYAGARGVSTRTQTNTGANDVITLLP